MSGTYGLYGHIQRNAMKSALLLAAFVGLIALTWFAWCLIYVVVVDGYMQTGHRGGASAFRHLSAGMARADEPGLDDAAPQPLTVASIFGMAGRLALGRWWMPLFFAGCWFAIAYTCYSDIIRLATRARALERREAPRLFAIVERLAIAAGLPVPRVDVIMSPARNAFASGLTPADACITVTTGLMRALTEDELEAVLAHEMTHVRNGDVRLMVIATVFAGGLTLVGNGVAKLCSSPAPTVDDLYWMHGHDYQYGANGASEGRGLAADALLTAEGGNPMALVVSLAIGIMFLATAHVSALMIRFAISRAREYLADAGAVELTKNPDALISALNKISGRDEVAGLDANLQAMMISGPIGGLFATHPSVESRIDALRRFAGGGSSVTARVGRPVAASDGTAGPDALAPAGALGIAGARASFGRRGPVRG